MLRPERMSKVSVTGSKRVIDDVIETIHDLNLVHLSDYDGKIEGFDNGNPMEGADDASEKLVTVRSLQSTLDVDEADAGPTRIVTDEALETELEEIRVEVNELDDRYGELEDELRDVEERIDAVEPFADLGIDLDLLGGYDSLQVAVGEGNADAVRDELRTAEAIEAFEVFEGDDTLAVFAYPRGDDPDALDDALVGVEFGRLEVPDAEGSPEAYVEDLRHERDTVESKLDSVESELDDLRVEHAGFLLATEEKLSIDVQKAEVPLQFATTERAFVAEGWIPSDEYATFVEAIQDAVGEHAAVEELEQADYEASGHGHHGPSDEPEPVTDDADAETATDGGTAADFDEDDSPPVIQDNPSVARPFEALTEVINRPKYTELDPTVVLFLTFPAFYGFMIGDLGYGILYAAIGFWLYRSFDSEILSKLGGVAMWAGGFTALFGVLYGEIFGLHLITEYVWHGALGLPDAPLKKGLHVGAFAQLWLAASLVFGIVHLGIGYLFGFVNDLKSHGARDAITESGGPMLLMVGFGVWLFSSHLQGESGPRPELLYRVVELPASVGMAALAVALLGLVLVVIGEGVEGLLESPTYALVNTVSYTRIAAVLLAKAGMAYVVNLLVFGAYEVETHGGGTVEYMFGLFEIAQPAHETHFMLFSTATHGGEVLFPGLIHSGAAGMVAGALVMVVGHLLVLALGVTSAGLQTLRLEYVEFFNKFYEGGGEKYHPFGYQRNYTTED
ncbi:A-type ATP synthase subunit I [Halobacterium hubeiense]|jgi:V/A-type H+-transporting ATPase subunit I|uniref:A-type ATP synthase subunit I n=1 Tax=Halobacterium hubeiense TaxID=1407499 RepID=A0A0U5H8C6_9EURY|nr:V-type ATP synthase subunit I [Halobacterium hubeiense]CQH61359.1 A-type ATP synthase subunit I [Halobacterium hubeiense]